METIIELVQSYFTENGVNIIGAIITAIAGYIGLAVKKVYTKYINDKTKEKVVKTCVKAIEQLYKDLNGEEKLCKVIESASDMLAEKGISITDLELRMLIESAVAEFNDAFNKPTVETGKEDISAEVVG